MPRTPLLIILTLMAALTCWVSYARCAKYRDDAQSSAADLTATQHDLADLARLKHSGARSTAASLDTPELSRQLRNAAAAAGLPDAPGSESGAPTRLGASDYSQTLVFLRFEPLSLRQLITFLHHLGQADPSSRATQIELGSPQSAGRPIVSGQNSNDLWSADVAVGYLTFNPNKTERATPP